MKPSISYFLLFAFFATASASTSIRGQEPETLETAVFLKPVNLADTTREGLISIPLDQEIYAGSTESWNDLRLLDSSEKEIPFILHRRATDERKTHRIQNNIQPPRVQPLENDGLEITFSIDREKFSHSIDGLTFSTRLRDFEHRVTVETRTGDEQPWTTLANNTLLYDYSRYMDVRNLEVPFSTKSTNTAESQFRIRIEKVTQEKESQLRELTRTMKNGAESETQEKFNINREVLKIDAISFWHETETVVATQPTLTDYPIQIENRREDEKTKATVVEFTSHREPLTQLLVKTEDTNFHRHVKLYALTTHPTATGGSHAERFLTQSSITKLSLPNNSRSDLLLPFTATRSFHYRLVIENGDSPPLKDIALSAQGETYDLLFFSTSGEKYSIHYGNALLESPKYDTLAIKTAVDSKVEAATATFGKQAPYKFEDPRSEWTKIFENRWIVGAVFVALILVLGLTLYQAGKRLSSLPQT